MATSTATSTATSSNASGLTGCVKWFDNGLNYGFITVLSEGEHNKTDVFVHQSNIQTKRDCFRTLYTGECVQFELAKSDNEKHPYHAVNVSGFNGVMLHCENPNYRPRGNFRGRGRGGFQSRGNRGNYTRSSGDRNSQTTNSDSNANANANATEVDNHQQVQTENATVEQTSAPVAPVVAPVVESVQTTTSAGTTQETGVRRGRGRGRKA
jgi:cold shock CspA family protein